MRAGWIWLAAALGLGACGGGDPEGNGKKEREISFPTPWEDAELGNKKVRGAFVAQVGDAHPGSGWFESGPTVGRDVAQVNVVDVGATWPVVQIRILGHTSDGWNEVEIDVALNAFVSGVIPIDGESATGQVYDASDGSLRYMLAGDLHIEQPGIEPGQMVEGSFQGVVLSEAQ